MPDYSGIINTIETAVYGRDMRQAIANGFRLCQSNEGGGGGSVTVDTTLTVSGQAADSKTVGDKFTDLESQISAISPGLSREEKDAILAYFQEQVAIHSELEDAYRVIYNLWNIPVESISLNTISASLAVGMGMTLRATVTPENAYYDSIDWSSSPEGIVSVDGSGHVVALSKGKATVKATCGGKSATCEIDVIETKYYSIQNFFTGDVSSSNDAESILEDDSFTTTLKAPSGYTLSDVRVEMGNYDITSSAYAADTGVIYVANVTGNIEIYATATLIVMRTITYSLSGVTANPKPSTIANGGSFSTTLTVTNQMSYQFSSIKVVMGGSDISSEAVLTPDPIATATVSIPKVTGDVSITASVEEVVDDLNSCSWAQIRSISDAGKAKNYFAVGDSKTIHLFGQVPIGSSSGYDTLNMDIDVFIIGFDHNSRIEGNNKITFCMGKKNGKMVALTTSGYNKRPSQSYANYQASFCIWPTELTAISWDMSTMYSWTLSNDDSYPPTNPRKYSLMAALPSDLRAVMKKTVKYARKLIGDDVVAEPCDNYLFLFSEPEVRRPRFTSPQDKEYQARYEYFLAGNSFSPSFLKPNGTISTSDYAEGMCPIWTRDSNFINDSATAQNQAYTIIQGTKNYQMTYQYMILPIMTGFCV